MYRRPKFLEVLHEIREEMSREADYDIDVFFDLVHQQQEDPKDEIETIVKFETVTDFAEIENRKSKIEN